MLDRHYVWESLEDKGLEHAHVGTQPDGALHAQGVMLNANGPVSLRYRLTTHPSGRVHAAEIVLDTPSALELALRRDPHGRWEANDAPHPAFDACDDIDIEGCAFTNALPIRRLKLKVGESVELPMLYVTLPLLEPRLALQRYTRLSDRDDGLPRYRYQAPTNGFSAEITVDADGFTVEYAGLFRCLHPTNNAPLE